MTVFSHPAVQDGWFREVSSQWPGQAMTLKVNKILHVEKSLYQDILVLESETYGNVLVLDGAIQCTERDEFSYQEMITHLPTASHPNPEKVLVIGGGDGGVVREALKYDSVKEVVLCDIDEAVLRVSKLYLPNMAKLLSDPRVTVHIGDGIAFLRSQKDAFDVIVSDSPDPVGPAASLFEEPYYQLLHDALRPGGHIAAQGECLWLHLPLIKKIHSSAERIGFAQVLYAFTTLPTYPSGQIGFLLAAKAGGPENGNLKEPTNYPNAQTRYWNPDVHRAAFVLPEFGRTFLEQGNNILPSFGAMQGEGQQRKKILLLGSGFVARPCAEYIVRNPQNELTIACRTLSSAQVLADSLPRTTPISLDVTQRAHLDAQVAAHDLVISLIPYIYHTDVVMAAIKGKTDVVTTSYISPAMRELDEAAKAAGITVLNEIGLDPGIDHLYAVKTIDEVHAKGGKVKQFISNCGGLPAPAYASNPLGYKFSWSARGVLLALFNSGTYLSDGKRVEIPGSKLMDDAKPVYISPAYAFVSYPNRDSTPFRDYYKINGEGEGETCIRSNLRYQGFPEFIKALMKIGWMNEKGQEWLNDNGLTWVQVLRKMLNVPETEDSSTLVSKIKSVCEFSDEQEASRLISGFRWLGLFSSEPISPCSAPGSSQPTLLDTLFARLEKLMTYAPGERDLVMLQHRFVVEWPDKSVQTLTSTLEAYGAPFGFGHSAMARTVGLPCGIATQLILDGVLAMKGVHAPYSKEICDPIRMVLEAEGICMVEGVL
ncbi:saccharopine dehydrogenase [Gymnopus androsaceus JB14]|uniref:Saccharopine dehydrogenase n=1 Tax=Gymnopus androsaceus JB14 TaxID=1447944 RepID=A0A6A4I4X5_9AGAR|nr:saccharopine dehydrogenase [Gymnopus androsaceus JB14]